MRTYRLFTLTVLVAVGVLLPLAVLRAAKASAADGEAVFKKNCTMCHYPDKADKKLGPGLKDLMKNKELPSSHKPATEANIREQIEKGSAKMPGFGKKLSAEEIDNLMEYLKTL